MESFLFQKKKKLASSVKGVLKEVYKKTTHIDYEIFFDFLGEALMEQPNLLEGKSYTTFLNHYENFVKSIKDLSSVKYLERERYFVEKYCLVEGEELLYSFLGTVVYRKVLFKGRVFLTNLRIIVHGVSFKPGGGTFIPGLHLLSILVSVVQASKQQAMVKSARSKLKDSTESKIDFGYQFPISHLTNVSLVKWGKGKKKGMAHSIKVTSTTETFYQYSQLTLTNTFDMSIFSEIFPESVLPEIVEVLQKLQSSQN